MSEKGGRVDFEELDELLRTCIQCGLCLNHCPTHRVTGDELESPRGRLLLLDEILRTPHDQAIAGDLRPPLDRCLGCRGCETVCPSGVHYGEILAEGRQRLGPPPGLRGRVVAWLVDEVLTRPRLLALLATPAAPLRAVADRLAGPGLLHDLLRGLPARRARWPRSPGLPRRGRVGILAGCAQWVFEPEVLAATARLVRAAGGEPCLPAGQGCCGALSHHQGSTQRARELAVANLRAFADCESVVVPSAGCSAFFGEYAHLLSDDPELEAAARSLVDRTEDLLPWLATRADRLRFVSTPQRVVYHGACHHRHAQGIVEEGPSLLRQIPDLELLEAAGEHLCCGSAGSYSLHHPELARRQRSERLAELVEPAPDLLITANPGCEFFLEAGLQESASPVRVVHLAAFLADRLESGSLSPTNPRAD